MRASGYRDHCDPLTFAAELVDGGLDLSVHRERPSSACIGRPRLLVDLDCTLAQFALSENDRLEPEYASVPARADALAVLPGPIRDRSRDRPDLGSGSGGV